MHATKPLRDVWRGKLPFAGYSIVNCSLTRLSGTSPTSLADASYVEAGRTACLAEAPKARRREPQAASLPVVIGAGSHPFPFRTRKLSLLPPMVLHGKLCGRVGRCRHYFGPDVSNHIGLFCVAARVSHT